MALKSAFKRCAQQLQVIPQRISKRHGTLQIEPIAEHDANVDIIDMDKYDSDFSQLSETVIRGLETYGFLSLSNVAGLDTKALESISETFFNRDIEYKLKYAKHKWNPQNENRYRGYEVFHIST